MSHPNLSSRTVRRAGWILALLLCLSAGSAGAQPDVNGLFHGDGDDAIYNLYATSEYGSGLYTYLDASTSTLYVALVVTHDVNDTVCTPNSNKAYTTSAGWGNTPRPCNRLTDSEFAEFTFECAPGSTNSWTWQQALGCSTGTLANGAPSGWESVASDTNADCGASSLAAEWPPGVESSSTTSWVVNVNTYQNASTARSWDLYTFGTAIGDWKTPFVSTAPDDVTQVPGYNTYSGSDTEWEWSMVYEWSVNLGSGGTNCGSQSIFVISGNSHHSPSKNGDENDECCNETFNEFSDWGDLPDTYATLDASGGPFHHITVDGPYLGVDIQAETDGVPTADATGDGAEEDGVTANVTSNWTVGSTQTFDVEVSNAPSGALLGAWIDWNGDGDFLDADEFYTLSVSNGTNTLSVTVGSGFDWANDVLHTRFRLFSSGSVAPGGSLDVSDSSGESTDGEVEDYVYDAGTLPVTLNAFTTEGEPGGEVTVRWQTASETDNVAFELWGRVGGEWQPITDLIQARGNGSSALPQSYEARFDAPAGLTAVQLVDYDSRGRTERFGSFRIGKSYGEIQPVRTIDWSGPRAERAERLRERGFADIARARAPALEARRGGEVPAAANWKKVRDGEPIAGADARSHGASPIRIDTRRGKPAGTPGGGTVQVEPGAMTHVAVTEPGIQRVTYEALRDGGLDLAGVDPREIAVTWRGEPVERWIDGPGPFGPGSAFEFLGRPPQGDDALYIDAALYQVSVDRFLARSPGTLGQGKARSVSPSYLEEVWQDRPLIHYDQSPTGDPWLERTTLVRPNRAATVTLDLPIEDPVLDAPSQLVLGLGGATNLPDLFDPAGNPIPEHNVEVWARGPDSGFQYVTSASTTGHTDWTLEATLPAGLLATGLNQVELRYTTDYFFSFVVVDRYGVRYPTTYRGPSLDFAPDPSASGYRIEGFAGSSVAAYAEEADGSLVRLDPRILPEAGGYAAELRQVEDAERVWVTEAPHAPEVFTTEAPPDLLAGPADLVVIAGSPFVGSQGLDAYVASKAAFHPVVVDVEDVYNSVGFGMALPSAITDYLRARNAVYPFSHVQLVGADCYDRLNYISQCVSHVPLPTAPVNVTVFSPSQNRLVDLTGDGVADKAVGQFSVRDQAELATIVGKGGAWDTSGLSSGESALLIADDSDGLHDFSAQIERLRGRLGWSETDVLDLAAHPSIQTARDAMGASLGAGRTVTVFSGHSSPVVWGSRNLLTASTAASLPNDGRPTVMVPLACETTYDISPIANVLGHQLLFGGDQGALAISGAVSLSSLGGNERMAGHVLDGLKAGLTLGEAVQAGREAIGSSDQELQDNWITQGDVTTRLNP